MAAAQVPEEKNKDGLYVPKGTRPQLYLGTQQVRATPGRWPGRRPATCARRAGPAPRHALTPHSMPSPRPPACTHPPAPLQNDRLTSKCVFFARVNPKGVSEKTLDTDVVAGDIVGPGALAALHALVSDVYLPVLQEQGGWGKMPAEHTKDFLEGAGGHWADSPCAGAWCLVGDTCVDS